MFKKLKSFIFCIGLLFSFYFIIYLFDKPNYKTNNILSNLELCYLNCDLHNEQHVANFTSYWLPAEFSNTTLCSEKSYFRGKHQKVISYSLYGDINSYRSYLEGIEKNIAQVRKFYSDGWIIRIYHDLDQENQNILCKLVCKHSDILDLCYIGNLPAFGNILGSQGNMWRFLPIGDPFVDIILSRDLDSIIIERELDAVNEWLESNKSLHVMRDHPNQRYPMLAGMWGARLTNDRNFWKVTAQNILIGGKKHLLHFIDQSLLRMYIWKKGTEDKDFMMQHDSFHCRNYSSYGTMLGFPTQRTQDEINFIGHRAYIDISLKSPCPVECRRNKTWSIC